MKKHIVLVIVLILALVVFAACSSTSTDTGGSEENVLNIGFIAPMTGPAATSGTEMLQAAQMAFEEMGNEIGGYTVNLVPIDSEGDAQKATVAYEDAVLNQGIQANLGAFYSGVAVAIMPMVVQYQIPTFFGQGQANIVTTTVQDEPDNTYWTKMWPGPSVTYRSYADAIKEAIDSGAWTPRNMNIALFAEDGESGRDVSATFKETFTELGFNVTSENFFTAGETDFYSLLTKIKDEDVSILAGSTTAVPSIAALVKQIKEVGMDDVIMCADGLSWAGNWYELTGDTSNGIVDQTGTFGSEKVQEFYNNYQEKYGATPATNVGYCSYESVFILKEVAEKALEAYGSIDKTTLHNMMWDMIEADEFCFESEVFNYYHVTKDSYPNVVYGEDVDRGMIVPIVQYESGVPYMIYPNSVKQIDFMVPGE